MISTTLRPLSYPTAAQAPREFAGQQAAGRAGQAGAAERASQPTAAASRSEAEAKERNDAEVIRQLAKRDREVRAHEQAHAAAGGAYAGAPSFAFQRGPDGRSYAVSGEVPIDISAIAGDPQATITKMQQVKRAALAPQNPSGADRSVAAAADARIVAARRELAVNGGKSESETQDSTRAVEDQANESAVVSNSGDASKQAQPPPGEVARELLGELAYRNAGATAYRSVPALGAGSLVSQVS